MKPEPLLPRPTPWAARRSFRRDTSSFSSRTSRLLGSSLITALQWICLARSAYLWVEDNLSTPANVQQPCVVCCPPERAEGLVVVDVRWTECSYHCGARIPPCGQEVLWRRVPFCWSQPQWSHESAAFIPKFSLRSHVKTESLYGMKLSTFFFFLF